jgi:hypothetical protein
VVAAMMRSVGLLLAASLVSVEGHGAMVTSVPLLHALLDPRLLEISLIILAGSVGQATFAQLNGLAGQYQHTALLERHRGFERQV